MLVACSGCNFAERAAEAIERCRELYIVSDTERRKREAVPVRPILIVGIHLRFVRDHQATRMRDIGVRNAGNDGLRRCRFGYEQRRDRRRTEQCFQVLIRDARCVMRVKSGRMARRSAS